MQTLLELNLLVLGQAVLLAALLAALGAEVLAANEIDRRRQVRAAWISAVLLVGAANWWNLQALASGDALQAAATMPWLRFGLALAAAAALIAAVRPQRARPMAFRAILLVLSFSLGLLQGLLVTAGHGPDVSERLPALGLALLVETGALTLMLLPQGATLTARALRLAAALAAAGLPVLAVTGLMPAILPKSGGDVGSVIGLGFVGMLLLGGALRRVLQRLTEQQEKIKTDDAAKLSDPLTGLLTRQGLEQALALAVIDADKTDSALTVVMFDLDGFNPINSSFGHDSGDALLRHVAQRLRACLGELDVAARIGADEFVLLLRQSLSKTQAAEFTARALSELSKPFVIEQRELAISCSAGIARYPDDGGKGRMLICADAAKKAAKRLGGACYCFYAQGMVSDSREQLDLLRDLRLAVERKELELYYQPKIDARSAEVTAAEALLRWRHPTRGIVQPAIFIPIAERFGYMRELGNWVIDDACRQARVWRESGLRMRVAINLSAHQMRQADIVTRIEAALVEHRIHPSLLTCEITESVVMENTQAIQDTFRRLGELGVHLSIDDFGTGYSSLSYLRQLPAKELKIDQSFVTDLVSSPDARAVVDAVIKLAHALGLRVVAEGVETQGQQEVLLAMDCDELQGFLFARPMSAQAILLWANDDRSAAPAFRASLFGDTEHSDEI